MSGFLRWSALLYSRFTFARFRNQRSHHAGIVVSAFATAGADPIVEEAYLRKYWLVVCLLGALLVPPAPAGSRKENVNHRTPAWVGTWATSPLLEEPRNAPPEPGFADSTIRQIVHISIGGTQVRVRFSNLFGATDLKIPSAHVALSAGGSAVRAESDKPLTFGGATSVSIPPGASMYSDAVDLEVAPFSDMAVTIYLNGVPDSVTIHPASHATSYLLVGNSVSDADMPMASRTDHWYFLNGVDVLAVNASAAVVTLGDSITDGSASTTNQNARWPDGLARRLQANPTTANVGVINEGIGGNRLLHDMNGPSALARFDRDVLSQAGVRWLIVLEGINDIGTQGRAKERGEKPATAQELIAAYQQIIVRAHAHNIRVFGATILPYQGAGYFTPSGDADRQTVNQWIRTSGQFDGVIDLEAATRDPQNPSRLAPFADSGDHLHPGDAGYKAMADAIDLKLFN